MTNKEYIQNYKHSPRVVIFQVGNSKHAIKAAEEKDELLKANGVETALRVFDDKYEQWQLELDIPELAPWVDGIIIQKPLPDKFDINKLLELIPETHIIDAKDPNKVLENFIEQLKKK